MVKAALGDDITKEDLGGAHIHAYESGVVDNVADSEEEAFRQIRSFLSYLPSSVDEMAPRGPADDPWGIAARRDPHHRASRAPARTYNARRLVEQIVDEGSFFPIAPFYGRARITGLARINGFPVGIMANDPRYLGGATDVAAGLKISRLLQLCDTFHLPLVDLADEPGLMVGLQSEKAGIERAGARLISIMCQTRMPWITVVVRRLFGVGGQAHHRPSGLYRRYAWPSASWGSMHIAGGTSAAYRREIEAAPDPDTATPGDRGRGCARWHPPSGRRRRPARTSSIRATPGRWWPTLSRTPNASWLTSWGRRPCCTYPDRRRLGTGSGPDFYVPLAIPLRWNQKKRRAHEAARLPRPNTTKAHSDVTWPTSHPKF